MLTALNLYTSTIRGTKPRSPAVTPVQQAVSPTLSPCKSSALRFGLRFGSRDAVVDPTQPGARFITTNRYDINYNYAEKAENLAQQTLARLESFSSPENLIAFVATQYGAQVVTYNSEFGQPRDYVDIIPTNYFSLVQSRLLNSFHQHAVPKTAGEDPPFFSYRNCGKGVLIAFEEKDSFQNDPNFPFIDKVLNATIPINGKPLTVLKTYFHRRRSGSELEPVWYFNIPKPEVQQYFGTLIREALALKSMPECPLKLAKAVYTIAKLHWLFTSTMPYKRGSAGIADILTKLLFDNLGIETPCWKPNLSPDIEALATPNVEEYIQQYPGFFQGQLRFKAPVYQLQAFA